MNTLRSLKLLNIKQEKLIDEVQSKLSIQEEVNKLQKNIKKEKEQLQFIHNFTASQVKSLVAIFTKISSGDLNQNYTITNPENIADETLIYFKEISVSLNAMIKKMREMITEIDSTTNTINSNTERLYSLSEKLNYSAKSISNESDDVLIKSNIIGTDINNIKASIYNVKSDVINLIKNTKSIDTNMISHSNKIDNISTLVSILYEDSNSLISDTKDAVDTALHTKHVIETISTLIKEIQKVVSTIRKVAEQTNLLALNASIEATAAGSAGRGFTVVAQQIKELAQTSSKATSDITSNIININSTTEDAIHQINEMSKTITGIDNSVYEINKSIDNLSTKTAEMNTIIDNDKMHTKSQIMITENIQDDVLVVEQKTTNTKKHINDIVTTVRSVNQKAQESLDCSNDVNNSTGTVVKEVSTLTKLTKEFNL